MAPRVDVEIQDLHLCLGLPRWAEAESPVESVGVPCREVPFPEAVEVGVAHDALDEPLSKTPPAVGLDDEDVPHIREGREVGDHAPEGDLPPAVVDAEAQGVTDRFQDHLLGDPASPVRVRQEGVDHVHLEARGIRRELEIAADPREERHAQRAALALRAASMKRRWSPLAPEASSGWKVAARMPGALTHTGCFPSAARTS